MKDALFLCLRILFPLLSLAFIFWLIFGLNARKIQSIAKPKTERVKIVYFNPENHLLDTVISTQTTYNDSIVSFISPSGVKWIAKDFINSEYDPEKDEQDITVNNGEHFKIITMPIQDTLKNK